MHFTHLFAAFSAFSTLAAAFTLHIDNACPSTARILQTNQNGYSHRNPIAAHATSTYTFQGPLTRGAQNNFGIGRGARAPQGQFDSGVLTLSLEFQDPSAIQVLLYAGGNNETSALYYGDKVTMRDTYTARTYVCKRNTLCCSAFCPEYPDDAPFRSDVGATVTLTLCAK